MKETRFHIILFGYLLLVAFGIQTFGKAFFIADYYYNTVEYAKKCINKARPQMHCNGKCQLMKKLNDSEDKSDKNESRKNNRQEEVQALCSVASVEAITFSSNNITYDTYKCSYYKDCCFAVFHPPKPLC